MTSRTLVLLAVLILASAGSAACRAQPQAAASGEVTTELFAEPRRPAAMRPVTLRLRFSVAQGRVAVRDLEVAARMPEMDHGAEPVVFRPDGPGRFVATHVFSMDGEWELQVRAVIAENAVTTRLTVRVGEE